MQLRHLRYFVAVGESESFIKGAERLHLSQPTVSQQIRDLEQELGTLLFERLPRGVKLTPAGRMFLKEVKQILSRLDEACDAVRQENQPRPRLRVGYPPSVGRTHYVLEQARAFQSTLQDIDIEMVEMYSVRQYEALAGSAIDVGFCFDCCERNRSLVHSHLETYPVVLTLPASHRLAQFKSIPVAELRNEPFVRLKRERVPADFDRIDQACRAARLRPNIAQEATHEPTLLKLVAKGVGLAFAKMYAGAAPVRGLVQRPVDGIRLNFHFDVVWRRNDRSPQLVRFMESIGRSID